MKNDRFNMMLLLILFVEFLFVLLLLFKQTVRANEQTQQAEQIPIFTEHTSYSLPGDDVPATGYASLEAMIDDGEYIEVNYSVFKFTHYCGCSKCCSKWSSGSELDAYGARGTKLVPYKSVAVDPAIIPLGTILHDEQGNEYVAQDTGSGIKGYRIDLFVGNHNEALKLGVCERVLYW